MKKLLYNLIRCSHLFGIMTMAILMSACEEDNMNAPTITGVINYAASPADTVLQNLVPGQWVVLTGNNLQGITYVAFNGIPADFNSTLCTDSYAVVQVPSVIPFPSIPAEQLNTINYITAEGATTFMFDIVAPPPTITSISNENANAGDLVQVNGTNLFLIENITFAGASITDYTSSDDGLFISFVLPELTQSGPVSITTKSGTYATPFNVNDVTTGALCNFDDVNTMNWGTGTSNSATDFPGNKGYYAVLKNGILGAGDGTWWGWERSINTNAAQWVPVDSLSVPVDQYALKFEINVPDDWNGTSIFIVKDYNWNYLARYEPWKNATYTTNGWQTVTIPLSSFRAKDPSKGDGNGTPVTDLTTLLGGSASGGINFFTINSASTPTATGFTGAIDNIRVVKIQ